MVEIALKNYAHIGDAVWEVFVRNYTILQTSDSKILHKITTDRVNATFQKEMLEYIASDLTEDEHELVRRARNLSIPVARRNIQSTYRPATAFEVLIGFWYLNNPERLQYFYTKFQETEFFR